MKLFLRTLFLGALFAIPYTMGAQITNIPIGVSEKINADSLARVFDSQPFFWHLQGQLFCWRYGTEPEAHRV